MKIVALADLHGRIPPNVPRCDVLVIAGDVAPDFYTRSTVSAALMAHWQQEWLSMYWRAFEDQCAAEHILMVPGNHDWFSELPSGLRTRLLVDQGCEIDGYTFWGTPWVAPCGNWNYQLDVKRRAQRFQMIPDKLDVLIHHSPAQNCGDRTYYGDTAGCSALAYEIGRKQPAHTFFGHIHEGQRFGRTYRLGDTILHHTSWWSDPARKCEHEPADPNYTILDLPTKSC